jgi:hypothetical protein
VFIIGSDPSSKHLKPAKVQDLGGFCFPGASAESVDSRERKPFNRQYNSRRRKEAVYTVGNSDTQSEGVTEAGPAF